ncbi:sugar-non-specific nuclease inhibitor NuiA-like protein [Mucilaginibacter robiniae]|uniref:Sugar-non-specific nuclease inhibitor NuiA-like protein n=1 Tax=Mucilaginibacter robiniae TaxID=2728022 RepID=A0A7L5E3H0_9SPHI|nr:nuclease A inhibitor family protein [Mucilaginibacter robiniae]QJD96194.1 sugar-non-specific nuclease inhibitor NuiA-like protein [Mucilaginibacter robiniae]
MSIQSNLEQAANGLQMMSESDYPFTYVCTEAKVIDNDLVLKIAAKPQGTPIEQTTIEHLLRNMTDASSGSVSPQVANQFQNLAATLKSELSNLTVYRVGEVQVDVFILGLTKEGNVAGMRTKLIET